MTRLCDDILYGGPEDESFSAKSLDEYVADYLDRFVPFLPETIEVVEYHREKLSSYLGTLSEVILEDIIGRLDDPYALEDAFEPTERMKEAAKAFEGVIREEYVPTITVHVKEWIKEHKPWPNWEDFI